MSFQLQHSKGILQLINTEQPQDKPLHIDFCAGKLNHRMRFGGGKGQAIAKAVGFQKYELPFSILDATAGLGADSFVFASLGANVTLLERHEVVHALLADAIARGQQAGLEACQRMHLLQADALNWLLNSVQTFTVIYLDPMYPDKKKSAEVNKGMQYLQQLAGKDLDADQLLALALSKAEKRVVVKRAKSAPFLANRAPSFQLVGKSTRFDIYTPLI